MTSKIQTASQDWYEVTIESDDTVTNHCEEWTAPAFSLYELLYTLYPEPCSVLWFECSWFANCAFGVCTWDGWVCPQPDVVWWTLGARLPHCAWLWAQSSATDWVQSVDSTWEGLKPFDFSFTSFMNVNVPVLSSSPPLSNPYEHQLPQRFISQVLNYVGQEATWALTEHSGHQLAPQGPFQTAGVRRKSAGS